jgi:hypothetical protein
MWHPPFNPFLINSGFGNTVHLAAPGVSVLQPPPAEIAPLLDIRERSRLVREADGTSLSAALVSGGCAGQIEFE